MKNSKEYLEANHPDLLHFIRASQPEGVTIDLSKALDGYYNYKMDNLEDKLLDAINRALRKWGIKEKLSFEDGLDLLDSLHEETFRTLDTLKEV